MTILITEKTLNIDEKELIFQLEVSLKLEDLDSTMMNVVILQEVAEHVAKRVLDVKMKELVEKVNLDTVASMATRMSAVGLQ